MTGGGCAIFASNAGSIAFPPVMFIIGIVIIVGMTKYFKDELKMDKARKYRYYYNCNKFNYILGHFIRTHCNEHQFEIEIEDIMYDYYQDISGLDSL